MTLVEDRPVAAEAQPPEPAPAPADSWLTTADHKRLGLLFVYLSLPIPPNGTNQATKLWIAGLAIVAFAALLSAINLVVTPMSLRTEGMTMLRVPAFTWASFVTGVVTLISTPVFLSGLLLLYLDQRFGGSFFDPGTKGSQIIWQHTLWLFGRPEIYLLTLPALGAACDIVATH